MTRRFAVVSFAVVLAFGASLAGQESGRAEKVPAAIRARTQLDGRSSVIVRLRTDWTPGGRLAAPLEEEQRSRIRDAQGRVESLLFGSGASLRRNYGSIPFQAWEVTPAALAALEASPLVDGVEQDALNRADLAQSTPLVQGDQTAAIGYTGAGQMVAILDTGVDSSHPFLGGRVTAEACFSTTAGTATSLCPNGQASQVGAGAASPSACSGAEGCTHGTHVAGIAAGSGSGKYGVARGAQIMAVQVFSRFSDAGSCSPGSAPCVLAYTSDIIAGLDWVYGQRNAHAIAAVNMSLGGGRYYTQASCDAADTGRKASIDNLRSAGIASVISSGNSGYTDSMGAPGCISTAVSVGSTTKSDVVSSFSNAASFLNLLAPGSSISSSVTPGTGFASFNGTSMAAPHVAGAWAVLKQRLPSASVAQALDALNATGLPVTDNRSGAGGLVKPRIRVLDALVKLRPTPKDATGELRADLLLRKSDGTVAVLTSNGTAFDGALGGASPVGAWSLYVADDASGDTGSIDGWSLTFQGTTGGSGLGGSAAITIPDSGPGVPYPSTFNVASFAGGDLTKVTVSIYGFTHTYPLDVDMLLVGPGGQKVMLMSDAGGGSPGVTGRNLTFDDAAAGTVPTGAASGTYRPTDLAPGETMPAPAPPGPYSTSLSAFLASSITPWTSGFVAHRYDVYHADVDGDGKSDLISRSKDDGNVEVFRSTGSSFAYALGTGPGGVWSYGWGTSYDLYFEDVTGDGKADLIGRHAGNGDLFVFPSTGSGFSSAAPAGLWSYGWSSGYDLFFGDVTGDGKADLVARYFGPTAALTGDVYVAISSGSGFAFNGRWTYGYSAGYNMYVADMDGDGKADILTRYYGVGSVPTGDVNVIYSTGSSFSWNGNFDRWSYGWGSTYEILVRDVTGDGKADFVGRNTTSGEVVVATSNGTSLSFQGTWATGANTGWDVR